MSLLADRINDIRDRIHSRLNCTDCVEYKINFEHSSMSIKCNNLESRKVIDDILYDGLRLNIIPEHSHVALFYNIKLL